MDVWSEPVPSSGVIVTSTSATAVTTPTTPAADRGARAVGVTAVAASVLYVVSDVVEVRQGGFSPAQLWLTLVAEAAVPCLVIGLAWVQRPALSRLGRFSALVYAYAFVYFTGTVVYALVERTPDYATLADELGLVMVLHGALMVAAGIGFGWAVRRAGVLPRWTGPCLLVGVVLVAATQGAPDGVQLVAAGVRDLAFAAMGLAVLLAGRTE
jgi:hypothetical protein